MCKGEAAGVMPDMQKWLKQTLAEGYRWIRTDGGVCHLRVAGGNAWGWQVSMKQMLSRPVKIY
jgi:hypothetical protein